MSGWVGGLERTLMDNGSRVHKNVVVPDFWQIAGDDLKLLGRRVSSDEETKD